MKVKEIQRTISGNKFDNFTARAEVDEHENMIDAFLRLDAELRSSIKKVEAQERKELEQEQKKDEMLSKIEALKIAVERNQVDDIPF